MSTTQVGTKYLFVLGGNCSGLGKGISAASIGFLLKEHGYSIGVQKWDPYLNADPGTMNPREHGEVFVLQDGTETDLDLGTYERFIDIELTNTSSTTSGRMYQEVLQNERQGLYLGRTVQTTPHLTDYLKDKLRTFSLSTQADVIITEIGGTVGDAEAEVYLDAIRQWRREIGTTNVLIIYLTYVPYLKTTKELKTKFTQQAVQELRHYGLQPDLLICRAEKRLPVELKQKIAQFCDLDVDAVFDGRDVESIYDVPLNFFQQHMDDLILKTLGLTSKTDTSLERWKRLIRGLRHPVKEVTIALVGKYVELEDAYLSVLEAFRHTGAALSIKVNVELINAELLEQGDVDSWTQLRDAHAILVPGGFGTRGIEGKISAIQWAREQQIPYLGICLGMQLAVIEFARNVLGIRDATSAEFKQAGTEVIHLMATQQHVTSLGGTMRLGAYPCVLDPNSRTGNLYLTDKITRRHRHRYEFNNVYREQLQEHGLSIVGSYQHDNLELVEVVELQDHPFFIGCQYHPEFNSRMLQPEPLFLGLVQAAVTRSELG